MDIGRNDPCPCGSGKKYKKCCMDKATESETSRTEDMERTENFLRKELQEFMMREEFRDDISNAWMLFWNEDDISSIEDTDAYRYTMFAEWFIHDYKLREHNIPIVELFSRRKEKKLSSNELSMLKEWSAAFYSAFEVQEAVPGKGCNIKDIFSGDEFFVNDVSSSYSFVRYDIVFLHLLKMNGKYYTSGAGSCVPSSAKKDVISYLDRKLQGHLANSNDALTMGQFVRKYPHYLNHFVLDYKSEESGLITPEGHVLCFSECCFSVNSFTAMELFFKHNSDKFKFMGFDKERKGGLRFDYLVPYDKETIKGRGTDGDKVYLTLWADEDGKEHLCLANLTLTKKMLSVQCMSKERLESLKEILSPLEDDEIIENMGVKYENASNALKSKKEDIGDDPEEDIPEDLKNEISKEFLERYTQNWLDMQIPALNNMTPRQAAKTEDGKRQLKEMLKDMENLYEHHKKQGRPYMNVPLIKKILGID